MKVVGPLVFAASLLAGASPALCQSADSASGSTAPLQRYLAGTLGAAASGTTSATFAAEYGETVSPHSQAYVNLSYVDNLISNSMQNDLLAAGQTLTLITGETRAFSGRDRGIAFTAGGKFVGGTRVRPYIGAGGGLIDIHRTITEASIGDVSEVFAAETGLTDGLVNAGTTSAIKPLGEVVAGVGFLAGKAYVDVGYRYRRVFHTLESVNFSQISIGIGAKW